MKTIVLLIVSLLHIDIASSQIKVEKNMLELSPNLILAAELKNLMKDVRGCNYHHGTPLIWTVARYSVNKEGCKLEITVGDRIWSDMKYTGFFYLGETLVLFFGALESRLFTPLGYKKMTFNKEQVWLSEFPIISDPPTWIYFFKNDDLSLHMLDEYNLPCN